MNLDHFLLISTSSRPTDYDRCSFNALKVRYGDENRLKDIPPLWRLSPFYDGHASYNGELLIYHLTGSLIDINFGFVKKIPGNGKIQHAAITNEALVICYEDRVELIQDWQQSEETSRIIQDNWFAGLHTVFENNDNDLVLSSSAADAALVLDLKQNTVTRRLRLPASIYGENYQLSEDDDLIDCYIHNDLQLGHLNCAYPDERGNIWVSTLIQGDIGFFDPNGEYKRVISGFLGAHGVRSILDRDEIYFAHSCTGTLVIADFDGDIKKQRSIDSGWMHDVQHLGGSVFILGASDRGKIIVMDTESDDAQVFPIPERDGYIQFFNLHRARSK